MTEKSGSKNFDLSVAIQGFPGAFHDMAARKFFSGSFIDIIPCFTFKESFDLVKESKADVAVVAIENSLAGSLLPNYALLRNSELKIFGEVYLRIEQHLMAIEGQAFEDIREIQSHPMAIIQCEEFLEPLRKKGVKIIDTPDTALSAREISEKKLTGVAAIASSLAAEMYGLNIIRHGIETNKRNFTRFLVLTSDDKYRLVQQHHQDEPANKASVCFSLPHKVGSLSQILSVLAFYKINLTKIQSAPIIGREWEYFFYVDLMFDDKKMYLSSLDAIRPLTDQLQIMGEYTSGNIH
jgi:prephenate dehydratase